jgi:hypothetical protein
VRRDAEEIRTGGKNNGKMANLIGITTNKQTNKHKQKEKTNH